MKYRELIRILEKDGWLRIGGDGSHQYYRHNSKPGKVPVPIHSGEIDKILVKKILKEAGINRKV